MANGELIVIGATVAGAADGNQYYGPVKVPGTMSKPSTIENHKKGVAQARVDDIALAPSAFADSALPNDAKYTNRAHRPMVGMLTSAYVIDGNGDKLYAQACKPPYVRGKVAMPLVCWLKQELPNQFASSLRYGDADPTALVIGFNIKEVLRIAAFEVLKHNAAAKDFEQVQIPVKMWHKPPGVYDPLDVLLPKGDQADLDLYSLMRYFGIAGNAQEVLSNAQAQAEVALELAVRAQFAAPGA